MKSMVDQGSQEEDVIHSDIQRLAPGGSLKKSSESPEVTKSMTKDGPLRRELASHQSQLTHCQSPDVSMQDALHWGVNSEN